MEDAWASCDRRDVFAAMLEAGKGASTGTEGLLLAIGYLEELLQKDPDMIRAAGKPIDDLISWCFKDGIILAGPLVDARRKASL